MNPTNTPLFSIIIPVYNVAQFISQTINSVLAQDFKNYEMIVVDDGSTDNSSEICFSLAQNQENIIYIKKRNGGLSDARNTAMKIAQGQYIIFLDGDDFWHSTHALSDLANIINTKNNPDIIIHTYQSIDLSDNNKPIEHRHLNVSSLSGDYQKDISTLVTRHIYLSNVWTKVVKREIILKNNLFFEKGVIHEDSCWSFELTKHIQSYAIYNNDFYTYLMGRAGSTTVSIPIKNIKDLTSHVHSQLIQLNEIKANYFYLYEALFNYISREMQFLIKIFNTFKNEEKQEILPKFSQCVELFNHYIKTDFSIK